jgi:DNA-binding response OmpR family regulator
MTTGTGTNIGTKYKVIVADDDPILQKLVRVNLQARGYLVATAADGLAALQLATEAPPSLVILDVVMPGMHGFEVCRRLRATSTVPIIMLTAKDHDSDVIYGFECGADDYVTKPFSVEVLLSRIQSVLRRTKVPEEMPHQVFQCDDLVIDFGINRVTRQGTEVILTATEYKIISLLAQNAGRIMTHNQILEKIWGWEYQNESHILQVAVARLRQKLDDDPQNPRYITTRIGIGYVMTKPLISPS